MAEAVDNPSGVRNMVPFFVLDSDMVFSGIQCFPHDYTEVSRLGVRDASDVLVAVVDCGLDPTSNALKANLWKGRSDSFVEKGYIGFNEHLTGQIYGIDFTEPGSPSVNPVPSAGEPAHGTSVASIIGARPGVERGHEGVAHSVQIMSLKVFPAKIEHYASSVSRAITFAVDHGAQVINCSFFLYSHSSKIRDAFQYAFEQGVLVVAAAGNEDADLVDSDGLPGTLGLPNVLTIGAIDHALPDHLVDKSNFGKKVDLAAPGGKPAKSGEIQPTAVSTSFATAYVSGACALVWQHMISGLGSSKETALEVRETVLEHARCVAPSIATGVDVQKVKQWGEGNRVLDLGFLA